MPAGKSTLAEAVVGLLRPTGGSIRFDGTELVGLRERARRDARRRIQMVAQNPLLSLSPRRQIAEPLLVHTRLDRLQRSARIDETIAALDLSPAVRDRFPHELSSGQAQRAVLARALILEPSLILFAAPRRLCTRSLLASSLSVRMTGSRHRPDCPVPGAAPSTNVDVHRNQR